MQPKLSPEPEYQLLNFGGSDQESENKTTFSFARMDDAIVQQPQTLQKTMDFGSRLQDSLLIFRQINSESCRQILPANGQTGDDSKVDWRCHRCRTFLAGFSKTAAHSCVTHDDTITSPWSQAGSQGKSDTSKLKARQPAKESTTTVQEGFVRKGLACLWPRMAVERCAPRSSHISRFPTAHAPLPGRIGKLAATHR